MQFNVMLWTSLGVDAVYRQDVALWKNVESTKINLYRDMSFEDSVSLNSV